MAKIGIDATAISRRGKGISRYQNNIVSSLSELESNHEYYVFLNQAQGISSFVPRPNWHFIAVSFGKAIVWEQFGIPYWMGRLRLDLFHTTTDRLPCFGKGRFLLQLFEIPDHRIHLISSKDGYPFYKRAADVTTLCLFPLSLRRAARILVSSKSTEKELVTKYRADSKKIRVIPLGFEETFKSCENPQEIRRIREKFGAPAGYLLHFSTGDPRENTETVLETFRLAQKRLNSPIKLLIVGSPKSGSANGVLYQPYLREDELIQAYQGALLYIDPSFYEGFALQVLEAMACGVPVVASNRTSIPEIVGNAGILVDPESPDTIAEAAVRILTDKGLQTAMRQNGIERAQQFSWQKTAHETLSVYEEILNGH